MIHIKSIFWKLFLTSIVLLFVSHFIFALAAYLLFQNHVTSKHITAGGAESNFSPIVYLFVVASSIALTITGLFTYYLSKRITAPLREMNQIAHQLAKGEFAQRVNIKTHDELGELGETFNYMAQELASLDQMRKDFVANISHDLRSPLTSIRGFVQAFLDNTIPEERKHHYLMLMQEQTDRMIALVNDLLDMARLEAGQLEIEPVTFNLSELIRQVLARMEPEFVKKQFTVELIAEEGQEIYTDYHLHQRRAPMTEPQAYRTPRWVKVFGIVVLIIILLHSILTFTGIGGQHGPGRHLRIATPTITVQQP